MKICIILRGVPGSGKSTIANVFSQFGRFEICCADDFLMENGKYNWSPEKAKNAHSSCHKKFEHHISLGKNVVVANTNTKPSDFSFYEEKAKENGYMVFHIVVENRQGFNDSHSVPEETKNRMRNNLLASIKL